jgi:predicted nucleotide-binding protein
MTTMRLQDDGSYPPEVDPSTGRRLLLGQIDRGRELIVYGPLSEEDFAGWELVTGEYLGKVFGHGSPKIADVLDIGKHDDFPLDADDTWWNAHRAEKLQRKLRRLSALVELLVPAAQSTEGSPVGAQQAPADGSIFLVHGHGEALRVETEMFLEKQGIHPVILKKKPDRSRSIMEKFEAESAGAGFAVVLLTPDDRGGLASDAFDHQKPRARQNVWFEMGFFIGRLGRRNVCVIHDGEVEIPSDYAGVVCIPVDPEGAWMYKLAHELKDAGWPIDLNRTIS